jgi:hypothetical protein
MPLEELGRVCDIEIVGSLRERGVLEREVLGFGWDDIRNVKRKGNEFLGRNDGTTKLAWTEMGKDKLTTCMA